MSVDYQRKLRALSTVLYESDPFVMGASISAPDDEYDSIAAHLLSLLRHVETLEGCRQVLKGQKIVSEELAEAVWRIVRES